MTLFPFADYWGFYVAFVGFVLAMLALDLGVFHRKAHAVGFREAAWWSLVWAGLALLFNFGLYRYTLYALARDPRLAEVAGFSVEAAARQVGLEFLAGYVVEKALSLDNIFVFVVVFSFFAIPARLQHRVLFYGIVGALACRAVFIALGSALLEHDWMVMVFGALLILTGVKMLFAPSTPSDPERNPLLRLFRRFVPVTEGLEGERFVVKRNGVWMATPLLVALLFVELSDVLFAVDSVPAIFALTREPLVVFTSNVFAILGLRSLYFLLAGAVARFAMLKYGLALVLVFVGLKMTWLNAAFGGHFPTLWSLAVIGVVLAGSIGASLLATRRVSAEPL